MLESDNALEWDFPGRAAQVPLHVFRQASFQENLSRFLERAAHEPLHRFAARANKAGAALVESRDTTDPGLLTQFLMPVLEATGQYVDTPKLRKRVRDDVNMHKAEHPWRRDACWLALRVAVQRQLCLVMGREHGRPAYKFLICAVLAQLLQDCAGTFSPVMTLVLRAKLCRRLAKLEHEKSEASGSARELYQRLFDTVGAQCESIITGASHQIETAWDNFKRKTTRRIPLLPSRAEESSLRLSLPRSGDHLRKLLLQTPTSSAYADPLDLRLPPIDNTAIHGPSELARRYFKLADLEASGPSLADGDCQARCIAIAGSIADLLSIAEFKSYTQKPDQMSIFILRVFELWVDMDKCAVEACPLLGDYNPLFSPEALDVLHLAELSAMRRLQAVQHYLRARRDGCKHASENILSVPSNSCFASRYLREDREGGWMRELQRRIEADSEASRRAKEREWIEACSRYDDLSERISSGSCVCTFNRDGSRNVDGCNKCYCFRVRKRMAIECHEDFLPTEPSQKSAIVFELGIPPYLQSYRNSTWTIVHRLGCSSPTKRPSAPNMPLGSYSQLKQYKKTEPGGVSMASIKKSFLQTHYKKQHMTVDLASVVLPSGLDFSYYDERSQSWVSTFSGPVTFHHLCGFQIPRALLGAGVADPRMAPWVEGPTSYETVASQTKRPSDMSVHEFMALQRLMAGHHRRWITILAELGSSNVNFSDEQSTHLLRQLVVQAGPDQDTGHVLRDVHVIFQDDLFCGCLREQIKRRLKMIESNWRETHCMELVLTLALRLHALTTGEVRQQAYELIKVVRRATLQWNLDLCDKFENATDAEEAMSFAQYRFKAALLCRQTFAIFADQERDVMDAGELNSFIIASISLQHSLAVDPTKLSPELEAKFMRDLKTAYRFRAILREAIRRNAETLRSPFSGAWYSAQGQASRCFSPWKFVEKPNDSWIVSVVTDEAQTGAAPQLFHYNFVEGHLLIDGQPLGRPPLDIIGSKDVKDLFGDRHLLTYPSPLDGMSHALATLVNNHEIHFGRRGNQTIIRAVCHRKDGWKDFIEFIPRDLFREGAHDFDIPSELVDGCTHWLDLTTGNLEVRRGPEIWKSKPRNWILNVYTGQAVRGESRLVDPRSDLCQKIHGILQGFVSPYKVTVYQPPKGKLSVELKSHELSFVVNHKNLLQCRQLHAEIDPNQDAGTLYGLDSKIVLRDIDERNRRSIIAGLGKNGLSYERRGMHVAVRVNESNAYVKFEIDNVLGRLTCPSETRLLYSMALFHALTSFPLPDPLTSSTGAEEACRILASGYSQPWMPLPDKICGILKNIEQLCPRRDYYPRDKRTLQTVQWNRDLTMEVQRDCYERLVQNILLKSRRLAAFEIPERRFISGTEDAARHLRHRAVVRRRLYERDMMDGHVNQNANVVAYESGDRKAGSRSGTNVYQVAKALHRQPFTIPKTNLVQMIRYLPGKVIGGFHEKPDGLRSSLDALISRDIGEQWGSLVSLCRESHSENIYDVVFRLGLLSFGPKADMEAINVLCAFSRLEKLQALQPPDCAVFSEFRQHESLDLARLEELILANLSVHEANPGELKHRTRQLESRQHSKRKSIAKSLSKHLFDQWPCLAPSTETFAAGDIEIARAMETVLTEWTRIYNNSKLSEFLDDAQAVMDRHVGSKETSLPHPWESPSETAGSLAHGKAIPSLSQELLLKARPAAPPVCDQCLVSRATGAVPGRKNPSDQGADTTEMEELKQILNMFTTSPKPLWQQYGEDLFQSYNALRELETRQQDDARVPDLASIDQSVATARERVAKVLSLIADALSLEDERFRWLRCANLWPRVSPMSLLQQLRTKDKANFGPGMKELLVSYGTSITTLQWLLRMRQALQKGDHQKLLEHYRDQGHSNWDPIQFPDWLLLEIESNLLIRREQIDVANAIISPPSSSNSVLQLNMGRGISSPRLPTQQLTSLQGKHPASYQWSSQFWQTRSNSAGSLCLKPCCAKRLRLCRPKSEACWAAR